MMSKLQDIIYGLGTTLLIEAEASTIEKQIVQHNEWKLQTFIKNQIWSILQYITLDITSWLIYWL